MCDKCLLPVPLDSRNFVENALRLVGFEYVGMSCKKSGGLLLCNDRSGAETTGIFSAHTATHSTSENAHETQRFSTKLRKIQKCQRTLDTNNNMEYLTIK